MLVVGHRGTIYDNGVSQNSMKAFQEAMTYGDGFETDAVLSKDGDIFLVHEAKYVHPEKGVEYCLSEYLDSSRSHTTERRHVDLYFASKYPDPNSVRRLGRRRIDQLTSDEVRTLRLKDGQPIPLLREAIALVGAHKGKLLNIELKAYGVVEPVLALVKQSIRDRIIEPDAVMLSSFNLPALQIVRQQAPELKVGAIFVGADQPTTALFPWRPESNASYTALNEIELRNPVLKQINPDIIVMPEHVLTEATAAMISKEYPNAKLAAWVFTERGNFDLPHLLTRLKSLEHTGKVMAMLVDHPRAFKQALLSGVG